jgi:hypothetical protein
MIPLDAEPDEAQKRDAIALILGGLGEAELKIAASYTTPFFWVLRSSDGREMMKGGSAFFLDTGERIFAVTAAHVVEECLQDTKSSTFVQCMLGSKLGSVVAFHLGDRLIDTHREIDIATFWITQEEIRQTGRVVLQGFYHGKGWPPPLPQQDRGVTYCGFPGTGRRWLAPREISFGCAAMAGIATNSHETSLSILVERENLVQVFGEEAMPENYDFGGVSGGPVLAVVQTPTLRSWMPAGVIIQGPNPSCVTGESISGVEIIKARPIHFIKANGEIDVSRWEQARF